MSSLAKTSSQCHGEEASGMKMNVVCHVSQIKKKVNARENDLRNRAIEANLFFNNRCLDA
ncbi:hypothetical protein EI42_04761 [Thermosporothrix hazakensis]|uniref:Uncharacterized protein n=1 Tax=Thermosporothrix hazakensis TaxID=644383 RepID=A0A326U1L5_THEHA|nr:hypothetical protein EI42_04761 [Thermosporothrix hazakensis]GCE50282.1 hypothetical protein KTH_51510 [Thermosporothrix hazakensis]